jgi:RecA/RadA recombinase
MTASDKEKELDDIIKKANARRAKNNPGAPPALARMRDFHDRKKRLYLPTGCEAINRALGGGWRLGVPHMIIGAEGSGKTSLALSGAKSAINMDMSVAFISTEQPTFPIDQAEAIGMTESEIDKIIFIPAFGAGENIFDVIRDIMYDIKTGSPRYLLDVIIIDSIAALLPEAIVEAVEKKGFSANTIGRLAALTSRFYPFICNIMHPEGVLISVNQIRKEINTTYTRDIAPGGNAVKYYNKTILSLKNNTEETAKMVDKNSKYEELSGKAVRFEVTKNNVGIPGRKGEYRYYFGIGYDQIGSVFDEAIDLEIIVKPNPAGNTYMIPTPDGEEKAIGLDKAKNILRESTQVYEHVLGLIKAKRDSHLVIPANVSIQEVLTEEIPEEEESEFTIDD